MTDPDWLTAIVGAHLGHSVALSAVLACSLLFARKMSGGGRYALCVFALLGAIILPAIALAPGASLVNRILGAVDAPIILSDKAPQEAPPAVKLEALPFPTSAAASGGQLAQTAPTTDNKASASAAPVTLNTSGQAKPTPSGGALGVPIDARPALQPPAWAQSALGAAAGVFARLPDMTLFFLSAWLIGTGVLLAKTGRDLVASLRMVRNSRRIDVPPALAQRFSNVRIAASEQAPGPIAAGLFRPSILLPVGFEADLERPGMVALLEHERAHVERRDMLVALGQRLALALLWWSPAMHWISRRMDEEREVACDEIAVERTGDPRAFALTLTHQAESQLWAQTPQLAAGAIGGRSQFGRRISRLVELARGGKANDEAGSRASGRLAFTGMALVAVTAACLTPGDSARAQDPDADRYDEADQADPRMILARADQTPPTPPAPPVARLETPQVTPLPPIVPLPPEPVDSIEVLSGDVAQLGIELSQLVTDEVLADLPSLLEEIFETIEETGVVEHEFSAEWREELAEMRHELRTELGPELRIQIQKELNRARAENDRTLIRADAEARADRDRAIAEARRELDRARGEMKRELSRARVEIDRARAEVSRALASAEGQKLTPEEREDIRAEVEEALAEARDQLEQARESGDLNFDFDFEFGNRDGQHQDFDDVLEGSEEDTSRRGPNAGNFYMEFDLEDLQNLSGEKTGPQGLEDHAAAGRSARPFSVRTIGGYDCPQNG